MDHGGPDRHMHQTPPTPCSEHVSLSNRKEAELSENYDVSSGCIEVYLAREDREERTVEPFRMKSCPTSHLKCRRVGWILLALPSDVT